MSMKWYEKINKITHNYGYVIINTQNFHVVWLKVDGDGDNKPICKR